MITVLGKDTKLWAIIAIPVLLLLSFPFFFFRILIFELENSINRVKVGINVVNIGGFILLAVWPWLQENPVAIHLCLFLLFYLFYSNGEFIIVQLSLFTVLLDF